MRRHVKVLLMMGEQALGFTCPVDERGGHCADKACCEAGQVQHGYLLRAESQVSSGRVCA